MPWPIASVHNARVGQCNAVAHMECYYLYITLYFCGELLSFESAIKHSGIIKIFPGKNTGTNTHTTGTRKKNERRNCAIKYRNRYTRYTHIESIRLVQRRCCGIRVDAVEMVDLNSSFPAKMWVRLSLREVRRQTSDQTKFLPLQLSFPIIQHRCFNG